MADIHKGCGGRLYYYTYGNPPIGVARCHGCGGIWEKRLDPPNGEIDPDADGFVRKCSPHADYGRRVS